MSGAGDIGAKVRSLPPFPAVIHKVIGLLSDPLVSADRIVEIVRYDQAITANVLRMCNSTLVGGVQRVSSLREALVRIGNRNLIHMVLSAGGADVLNREMPGYDLARGDLWKHSVLCALLAESLCDLWSYRERDKAYTAGLLHDIGKVVLNECVGRDFDRIEREADAGKTSFEEAEGKVLGVNHAEVGGRVAEEWNFDEDLVDAIRYHHHPAGKDAGPLTLLVHLSDVLCMTSGIGGGADGLRYRVDFDLLKEHGVGAAEFEQGLIRLVDVRARFQGIVAMYE